MAHQWSHRSYDTEDMRELCPLLTTSKMRSGFRYFDAQTDDARLVLRLIRESVAGGGLALNYARVISLLKTSPGIVSGVVVDDTSGGSARQAELHSRVVINATGAWADRLRAQLGRPARLRPLRGSHLVFQCSRLPLTRAVSFLHPSDGRPVFALPWEGVVIFGTTDVDQGQDLLTDPSISQGEADYLLEALNFIFPAQELSRADVTATFSGIRPVIDTGKLDPSKESREHVIWDEKGLLTVSGGKLTTFRIMARDALKAVRKYIGPVHFDSDTPVLDPFPSDAEKLLAETHLAPSQCLRLLGRYGFNSARELCAGRAVLELIPNTLYSWAELQQAARSEAVVHLADLLLRRVRLGLLLPHGGQDIMPAIRSYTQAELCWDDTRWELEERTYADLWNRAYRL